MPILINTSPTTTSRPKPFRFKAMWIRDITMGSIIHEVWNKKKSLITLSLLMSKIKNTNLALKEWNRTHFGNLQTSIKNLISTIDSLQSNTQTPTTIKMEQSAQRDLDELLLRERTLWQEKAKTKWLEEGDANTTFFHLTIILHRRNNHIHYIVDNEHNCITNDILIGDAFVNFFSSLFSSVSPVFPLDLQDLIRPSVSATVNSNLVAIPNSTEIQK